MSRARTVLPPDVVQADFAGDRYMVGGGVREGQPVTATRELEIPATSWTTETAKAAAEAGLGELSGRRPGASLQVVEVADGQTIFARHRTRCRYCAFVMPMANGPLTNCPRCAADPAATERIADRLMVKAAAAPHPRLARELMAMALAWYRTCPDVDDELIEL